MIALADHIGDGLSTLGLLLLAVWAVWAAYGFGRWVERQAHQERARRIDGFRRAERGDR